MLDRWRRRMSRTEQEKTINEHDETGSQSSRFNQEDTLHTKVTYQYPKKGPFRFPVIPDQEKSVQTNDVPAYKRKKNRSRPKQQRENVTKSQSESQALKSDTQPTVKEEQSKPPFKPTEVASPIYGYGKRQKMSTEVEHVPAYVRRERQEANHVRDENEASGEQEHVPVHEQPRSVADTSVDPNTDMTENATVEKDMLATEERVDDQKGTSGIEETATKLTQNNQPPESKHVIETVQPDDGLAKQQAHDEQAATQKVTTAKPEKDDRKKRKERQARRTRRKQVNTSTQAFNVMMTPRDKYNLRKNRQNTKRREHPKQITQHHDQSHEWPFDLLNKPPEVSHADKVWVQQQQALLEKTLEHFNVQATVVHAAQGPSVTRFEVQPAMGVKVSRIRNLNDDIKLNMSAKDIRIEAPIPGKNAVGIEVPNLNAQMVGLREIFTAPAFQESQSKLSVGLGLDVEGTPHVTDISKMPHGLIAGATGSGKSVCINTILISLMYKAHHDDVKFLLIDPKMVELAPYNDIPHLVAPVITDIKAATAALKWAVEEMESRYEKFVKAGVRDITRYNEKMKQAGKYDEKLPFIVIVIDELADLMMMSPQDVEAAICRIAQKARACGMHLLLATQRPSVDVITGLIKANIPTRIAFSVSSQVDSRTIIDMNGAERLLGKGDMLFIENGSGKSCRLQGAFVSDEEIEKVTEHARTRAKPQYLFEEEQLLKQVEADEEQDPLFDEIIEFIMKQNHVSTSLLQRQFRIGYNRAARLIDALESHGLISGQNGSKPRDVLSSFGG